jgi:DNA polymerase-3 subunit epsilon
MTTWAQRPIIAIDIETTGTDIHTDRMVSVSIIHAEHTSSGMRQIWGRDWLIDPGMPIPSDATAIHGIDDQMVAGSIPDHEAAIEIWDQIVISKRIFGSDTPIVAFNAVFDLSIICRTAVECWSDRGRFGGDIVRDVWPVFDPMVIDAYLHGLSWRSLRRVAASHGMRTDDVRLHTAFGDATLAARIAYAMGVVIGDCSSADLHDLQVGWYREQAGSRGIDNTWPIECAML